MLYQLQLGRTSLVRRIPALVQSLFLIKRILLCLSFGVAELRVKTFLPDGIRITGQEARI